MKLIVAETATKADALRSVLHKNSTEFSVVSCDEWYVGLSTDGLGVDTKSFSLNKKVLKPSSIVALKKRIEDSELVYAATSPSDEGEALAAEIFETASRCNKTCLRMPLHSVAAFDVFSSLSSASTSFLSSAVDAHWTTNLLDKLTTHACGSAIRDQTGMAGHLSPALFLALREIVRLEKVVGAHSPKLGWQVRVLFDDGTVATSKVFSQQADAESCLAKVSRCRIDYATVPCTTHAPSPFSFFNVVSYVNSRYGMSYGQVAHDLLQLYYKGYISYPFVTSTSIPAHIADAIRVVVSTKLDKTLLSVGPQFVSTMDAVEHGIYVTDPNIMPSQAALSKDLRLLYTLVWFRCIVSQGAPWRSETQSYSLCLVDTDDVVAHAIGDKSISPGWSKLASLHFIDSRVSLSDIATPAIAEATVVPAPLSLAKRHTVSSLLAWLLCRFDSFSPLMLHSLMSALFDGWVEQHGGVLKPTQSGIFLTKYARKIAPSLYDVDSINRVVSGVSQVRAGWVDRVSFLRDVAWPWVRDHERCFRARKYRSKQFKTPKGGRSHLVAKDNKLAFVADEGTWSCPVKFDRTCKLIPENDHADP